MELKILYQFGQPGYISDQGTRFTDHAVPRWAEKHPIRRMYSVACHSQSNGLIENWNGLWEHWLCKMGDKGTRGWLTCLQERVLTLNVRRLREGRFLCFSRGLGKGVWERLLVHCSVLTHTTTTLFFPNPFNGSRNTAASEGASAVNFTN